MTMSEPMPPSDTTAPGGTTAGPLLSVESLSHRGDGGFLLQIARFSVESGKAYGITGANGAGKTTLLRTMAMLNGDTSGRIVFQGDVLEDSRHSPARIISQQPQFHRLP